MILQIIESPLEIEINYSYDIKTVDIDMLIR